MALDIGINFRATSGYVTDGTNETYCLASDGYPTTRGGVTFGWTNINSSQEANRDSGVDRRLAGINYRPNSQSAAVFRLDLEATGDHEIHAAFGDTAGGQVQSADMQDNGTSFKTIDSVATSTDEFADATGVVRSEANWPSNEAAVSHTFSSTVFEVDISDPTDTDGNSTTVAHIRVVEAAAGGGTTGGTRSLLTLGVGA